MYFAESWVWSFFNLLCLVLCLWKTNPHSLLTVGRTVDEAAFLFSSLDNSCHAQLLADAAAANGVPKRVIDHEVAQFTADAVQNPVCFLSFFIFHSTTEERRCVF